MSDSTSKLEGKIDRLAEAIATVQRDVTRLQIYEERNEKARDRFWNELWPNIENKLTDHEVRLSALERLQLQSVTSRVTDMEKKVATYRAWILGATVVVGLVVGGVGTVLTLVIREALARL